MFCFQLVYLGRLRGGTKADGKSDVSCKGGEMNLKFMWMRAASGQLGAS